MANPRLKVLIADDHPMMLEGLSKLLGPDCDVAGRVSDGRALLKAAERTRPDLVITDIAMPEIDGIEATRRLRASVPGVRVLILSIHTDPSWVQAAFEAGACGYLTKTWRWPTTAPGSIPRRRGRPGGLGLASIEERAHLLGGRCRIVSARGAGTEIEVVVPFSEPVPEQPPAAGAVPRPRYVGPYRLLEEIGSGATATVYLAEEPKPLGRRGRAKGSGIQQRNFRGEGGDLRGREQQALARSIPLDFVAGLPAAFAGPPFFACTPLGFRCRSPDNASRGTGNASQRPSDASERLGSTAESHGSAAQRPGNTSERSGSASQRSGNGCRGPGNGGRGSGNRRWRSGNASQRPGSAHRGPGNGAPRPGSASQRLGNACQTPGSASQELDDASEGPGNARWRPGSTGEASDVLMAFLLLAAAFF